MEQTETYHTIFAPDTSLPFLQAVIKNILLETHSYGHHISEACFTAIGRFPKHKPQLMRPLIEQLLDEVYHPELALRDYVTLGGDEAHVRSQRISPAAFAVAATCRMLAERESPFCYLGYVYLLESTTPVLTDRVQRHLQGRQAGKTAKFIALHAKEDIKHQSLIREQTKRIVDAFPEAAHAIEYGLDCFSLIYPAPVWKTALDRARQESD
jgi:hypothetical protein